MDYPQEKVMPYGNEGKKAEQVEQMFDHIAPTYDRLNHTLSLGIDRRWRKKAIRWLAPFRPQEVLDVATGTGDFALLACRLLQPHLLTGIDLSEGMMQVGRQKAKEAGLDGRIRFERYCYGEAACLVFSVWGSGFDAEGRILWDKEPTIEADRAVLPRVLTDIQEDGCALQFDGARKRYVKTEAFETDKANGYTPFKMFWLRRRARRQ